MFSKTLRTGFVSSAKQYDCLLYEPLRNGHEHLRFKQYLRHRDDVRRASPPDTIGLFARACVRLFARRHPQAASYLNSSNRAKVAACPEPRPLAPPTPLEECTALQRQFAHVCPRGSALRRILPYLATICPISAALKSRGARHHVNPCAYSTIDESSNIAFSIFAMQRHQSRMLDRFIDL